LGPTYVSAGLAGNAKMRHFPKWCRDFAPSCVSIGLRTWKE
jgi:hypothetical protein